MFHGLKPKVFYRQHIQENMREIWKINGRESVEVVIDTWPGLNPYVEVEASSEEVKEISNLLGFDVNKGIAGGTEFIYELKIGIPKSELKKLKEITFDNPPNEVDQTSWRISQES